MIVQPLAAPAAGNSPPAGLPTIAGSAIEGQVLTVSTAGISDADGLGAFVLQWFRGSLPVPMANGLAYALTAADIGAVVTVRAQWIDGMGKSECAVSLPTDPVISSLGPELLTNPSFDAGLAGWTIVTQTPTASGGQLTLGGTSGFSAVGQSLAGLVTVNDWYLATATVISTPPNGVTLDYRNNNTPGSGSRLVQAKRTSPGVISMVFQAHSIGSNIEIRSDGTDGGVVGDVSIRRIATVSNAYYVDSVAGSNSNTGTLEAKPLKDLTSLPTLAAGTTVYLKAGSLWRQSLAPTNDNTRIIAYGAGAAPIIDGSDAVTASEWAPTSGQAGVYEITRTALSTPSGQHASVFTSTGLAGVRAASLAACQSTPGSFFDAFTTGNAGDSYKIHLHPAGSTDPRLNGVQYFVNAARLYCVSAPNATVVGVSTRRQLHHDGSLRLTGVSSATSVVASEGQIHDIYWEGGLVENAQANNAEAGYSFVLNYQGTGTVGELKNSSATHATGASGPGFFIHGNSSSRTEVHNLTIDGFENGVVCYDIRGKMIFNGIKHKRGNVGSVFRTIDLANQFNPSAADVFIIRPRSLSATLLQLNNLDPGSRVFVWEPMFVGAGLCFYGVQCTEVHIVGGLLVGGATSETIRTLESANRGNLTVKHTVSDIHSSATFFNWIDGCPTLSLTNNVYWKSAGGDQRWQRGGTQYIGSTGWANWQAAGLDAGSVYASDPLYTTNPAGVTTLSGLDALLDSQGRIIVGSGSPLESVQAGPGRVPLSYQFPAWVPANIRALCGRC